MGKLLLRRLTWVAVGLASVVALSCSSGNESGGSDSSTEANTGDGLAACREIVEKGRQAGALAGEVFSAAADFAGGKIASPEFNRIVEEAAQERDSVLAAIEAVEEDCTPEDVPADCIEAADLAFRLAVVAGDVVTLAEDAASGKISIPELSRQGDVLLAQGDPINEDLGVVEGSCHS